MHLDGNLLRLSATDLAKHLVCKHLIQLERSAAEGKLDRLHRYDPGLDLLIERGLRHEQAYVETLRKEGRDVADLRGVEGDSALERTVAAMRAGAGVILQPSIRDGRWGGRADLLIRTETPSDLGAWSYEVADTKLSQETRGGTVLQLCLYSDIVGKLQGFRPVSMHVVKPGEEDPETETFRFDDFGAYYRLIRRRLEERVDTDDPNSTYPDPVEHCEICAWWSRCDKRRRSDDHLSLVAGMQSLHRGVLERQEIRTLTDFSERELPLDKRPERGNAEVFERLHGQARIQLKGRREKAPRYELLPVEPDRGLTQLPEPSPGDIYFDLESDAFVPGGGIEYLFGFAYREGQGPLQYQALWGLDHRAERRAFEGFVDFAMERWRNDPEMHIYHFSPYEPGAIKRLMGRHASRESEIDELLRAGRFVDLHAVTRQGVRASVERYSLKDLEAFTGFEREVELRTASAALWSLSRSLELGTPDDVSKEDATVVEGYNRDDCLSTEALQGWLERLRVEHQNAGTEIPRPETKSGDASELVKEHEVRVRELFDQLVRGLPDDRETWSDDQRARWLLAHLLDYFRREINCAFWEFYRLHELDHEDLLVERKTVAGLNFKEAAGGGTARCPVHRYEFPPQEAALSKGDTLHEVGGREVGSVSAIDQANRTLDIKKRAVAVSLHPSAILVEEIVRPKPMDESILDLAQSILDHGIDGDGPFRAARDLLLGWPPRLAHAPTGALRRDNELPLHAAVRLAKEMRGGVLAIQGPPGSGKTFTGGQMIAALSQRNRIGVTANSHKVIANMLDRAIREGEKAGSAVQVLQKAPKIDPEATFDQTKDNAVALAALDDGKVVGATTWLWSRDDAVDSLDYLFVDEAGQLSLAQILAAGRAAKNIVLLGDPQQLVQPQQGTHPEGSERSALEHILDGEETMPEDRGLFLDRTWRMHPSICAFTSELFYDGRLVSREGLELQRTDGTAPIEGSGLFYLPVSHSGNQNSSSEEVEAVAWLVEQIVRKGATWTDSEGKVQPIGLSDVLIVAPYNAQVGALSRLLPDASIGTVDKFQGQEAPVVIYSMASSSMEDAPRGLEFLFDPHRFNVATSRARCSSILVASPELLEPDCRTPKQMRWANAVCRFRELATEIKFAKQ